MEVAYLCDGKACDDKTNPRDCWECIRTTDINHAKNFICFPGSEDKWLEKGIDNYIPETILEKIALWILERRHPDGYFRTRKTEWF